MGDTHTADILIIGAGFGGICMGLRALRAGLRPLILERASDVGGTWRDNTYPGCACDTQSHHYSLSFAPNPDWSQRFPPQPEILAYARRITREGGLWPHIRFQQTVTSLTFDTATSHWTARTAEAEQYRAPVAVTAVGQLNQPAHPRIEGMADFPGPVLHSAHWDNGFDPTGQDIAVVGSGASAIQMIPPLADKARHLTVFQRSPNWVVPRDNRTYSNLQRRLFRYLPGWRRLHRAAIWWEWERSWPEFIDGSRQARKRSAETRADIRAKAGPLADALTPDYPLGCKRILLADDLYPTLRRGNVTLIPAALERVEGDRLIGANGQTCRADAIALATGFRARDFLPGMTVIGPDGVHLHDRWKAAGGPEAYLGLALPGFPNLFFVYGPNTNLGHNSILFMIECQAHAILGALRRMRRRGATRIEVTEAAMARYSEKLHRDLGRTAWAGGCDSWYKGDDGRIINNWSGSTLDYWWRTRRLPKRDFVVSG